VVGAGSIRRLSILLHAPVQPGAVPYVIAEGVLFQFRSNRFSSSRFFTGSPRSADRASAT
jgi:hypothetical protein